MPNKIIGVHILFAVDKPRKVY